MPGIDTPTQSARPEVIRPRSIKRTHPTLHASPGYPVASSDTQTFTPIEIQLIRNFRRLDSITASTMVNFVADQAAKADQKKYRHLSLVQGGAHV